MENKKLKLDELRVQSFVTELEKGEGKTLEVQGGATIPPRTIPVVLCVHSVIGCESIKNPCIPRTEIGCNI